MISELVTDEMRATCLEAHDEILTLQAQAMMLRSDLDEARSDNLRLRLCLSCLLQIAENGSVSESDAFVFAFIRATLGVPPVKCKPSLRVVSKEGDIHA